VACREVGGAIKASLHESGAWHVAYTREFYGTKFPDEKKGEQGRFIEQWEAPSVLAPGVSLALRVVTPWQAVATPAGIVPDIVAVPKPPEGRAIEFAVFLLSPGMANDGWPGMRSMGTAPVGDYLLENGSRVWVVWHEIAAPKIALPAGPGQFFKGKSTSDLKSDGLRLIVLGKEPDGSRALYDYKVSPGVGGA